MFKKSRKSLRRSSRGQNKKNCGKKCDSNETIELSDSDSEEIVSCKPVINEDDIEVIDVADMTLEDMPIPTMPPDTPSIEKNKALLKTETDDIHCLDFNPPVIEIDDEPDSERIEQDDDGIEVVAVVVKSNKIKNRKSNSNRKRPSDNVSVMQESIKRAKHTMRRTSLTNSSSLNFDVFKGISANSRQIGGKKNKNKIRKKIQQGLMNRQKEDNRRVIYNTAGTISQIPMGKGGVRRDANEDSFNFRVNVNHLQQRFVSSIPLTTQFRTGFEQTPWMPRPRNNQRSPAVIEPGSNVMNVGDKVSRVPGTLRPIVIDGCNVGVGHALAMLSNIRKCSAKGVKICVDYFIKRGHQEVVVFLPRHKLKHAETLNPEILEEMERSGHVKFTPSREVDGKRIASYDDLYIVQHAHDTGGIIVTNDNFKDLYERHENWRETITLRLIQYTWLSADCIMFPPDPLGRNGPSLDEFLRF